ncbi:MAG: ATP-dependent Clp protease proteolytic subunit [Clostridiales bacterium]|nr:ATP-dependent Clp protease proteolytic subunit [Clostridiales bacterium]
MNVIMKSSGGITQVSADSRLFSQRKVFVEDEIDMRTACDFLKKIMLLNEEDSSRPIDVLISCLGGEINAGMLMYDVIQDSKAPVRMFCIGRAYSMGAVLFASGNHGRYMLPHSELMIHEPMLGGFVVGGNSSSIQSASESLLETKRGMNRILAKHTGRSEEEIEMETRFDHFFSPEESIRFGLCDQIIGFDRIMEGSENDKGTYDTGRGLYL